MLGFMDYVQNAFYGASHWNRDNSYGSLTATARALLDFDTPRGLRLNVSSLSSPNFATSYTLGSIGAVDGSLSYLYSSLPLNAKSRSNDIELRHVIEGYRQLQELRRPHWPSHSREQLKSDQKDALLYGRLYLPQSTLEALYLRRLSATQQLKLSCVSDSRLKSGGTILALFQHDVGKYSTEYLYSTDSALFGVRGLYNFGPDPRLSPSSSPTASSSSSPPASHTLPPPAPSPVTTPQQPPNPNANNGRFSAGLELYYGLLNQSGGVSTGIRFATLPQHAGFPYTMTLTLNPLMGNLSSTYAVKAARGLTLCSRFDFNVYSYESELVVGMELWRRRRRRKWWEEREGEGEGELGWVYRKLRGAGEGWGWEGYEDRGEGEGRAKKGDGDEDVTGVLKARVDQDWNVGVLWEGRVKELLYSCGASVDLRGREKMFRGVGVELMYSS